jgi:hypothetical protein
MKLESRRLRTETIRLPMIVLLLAGLVSLSGCVVTNKVLDLRKERETRVKEATNFWSLSAVRSAHIMAGSEIFACTDFRDFPADAPQAYTINLSQASRIGKTYADFMPAGYSRTESPRGTEEQPDVAWYLYPLQEAQKGCSKATGESPFPVTALKIETVQIHHEDQSRLPAILLSPDGGAANEGRIIEVSFASGDHGTRADPELKKESMAGPSNTGDVLGVQVQAGLFPAGQNIEGRVAWSRRHRDGRPLGGRRHPHGIRFQRDGHAHTGHLQPL